MLVFPVEAPKAQLPWTLTDSERHVTELTLKGFTNEEIATLRGVSHRTVANQLQAIYRKLGIGSRVELAQAVAHVDLTRLVAPGRVSRRRPIHVSRRTR